MCWKVSIKTCFKEKLNIWGPVFSVQCVSIYLYIYIYMHWLALDLSLRFMFWISCVNTYTWANMYAYIYIYRYTYNYIHYPHVILSIFVPPQWPGRFALSLGGPNPRLPSLLHQFLRFLRGTAQGGRAPCAATLHCLHLRWLGRCSPLAWNSEE